MHELYELKEMLCKELEEIGGKGELTAGSLDTVDKLAHALKNIDKVIEVKEEEGYSMADGSYARGRSNARRDNRGRYSSDGRGGYSRNYSREYSREGYSRDGSDMAQKLRTMADEMDKM